MDFYMFFVTVPNIQEGKSIARILVERKLAACVSIIRNITSIYEWKEKIEENEEEFLIIKTSEELSEEVIDTINEIHSYDTPECIGFKIEKGSEKYLKWIEEIVSQQ